MSELADRYRPMIEHDREQAIHELLNLTRIEPTSVEAHALLTVAYQRCMDFAASAEAARAVLRLEPTHADALHQLALSQTMLDDDAGALETYRGIWETTRTAMAGHSIGLMLHRLGRLDEARDHLDSVLPQLPFDNLHFLTTARSLMRICRDQGRPLESDHHAHALILRARRQPLAVSSQLLDRDQSSAFPEWIRLAEKARLADLLTRSRAVDPGGRFPETFDLPRRREELIAFAAAAPQGTLLIAKPVRGSGGQGISVTDDVTTVADRHDVVVQRYLDRPYLIDGRKGHLRIYALITGLEPLRAYVYDEGIVRFAPEPYDSRRDRLTDISMHVTNTALHHGHPGLVISENPDEEDVGAIWSLSAVLRRLAADGHDRETVLGGIRELIGWFLRQVEREGLFARQAARGPARAFGPKLLGFDVLLDADAHPWLLEIQTSPAATGSPLVNKINGELFTTIFNMSVGVLAEDDTSLHGLAALREPVGLVRREIEIESDARGRFRPIWD
jgi:tetratricopeptide (TPR) repeat protein